MYVAVYNMSRMNERHGLCSLCRPFYSKVNGDIVQLNIRHVRPDIAFCGAFKAESMFLSSEISSDPVVGSNVRQDTVFDIESFV